MEGHAHSSGLYDDHVEGYGNEWHDLEGNGATINITWSRKPKGAVRTMSRTMYWPSLRTRNRMIPTSSTMEYSSPASRMMTRMGVNDLRLSALAREWTRQILNANIARI